ncbi:SpoIIE family protein phosphatase [Microbacterium sp. JZ31]|uniref:SpoIIE family protein phosphatase n=1 Tax=Microbacterium sp. JZ31 TaxID=1906274 RepID=UPI0019320F41|nr:SpoIIE family protein phosphatase [Microbacterium sp. JZ31]
MTTTIAVPQRAVALKSRFGAYDALTITAYAVLYALALALARQAVLADTGIGVVMPAAGISLLWIVARANRPWPLLDYALIAAISTVLVLATGGSVVTAVAGGIAAALQALVCAMILRVGCPRIWSARGARIQTRGELWTFIGAALAGPFVSAPLLEAGSLLAGGGWDWNIALLWWVRNAVSIIVGVPLGFTVIDFVRRQRSGGGVRGLSSSHLEVRAHPIEWYALLLLSPAIHWVWFMEFGHLNLVFPLLALACWSGARLPTVFVMLQGVLVATAVILVTLLGGGGPFASMTEPSAQIAVAHLYIAMAIVIGLALAAERDQRELLLEELGKARRQAEEQSTLLETIIENMSEGVRVVDPDGQVILRNRAADALLLGPDHPALRGGSLHLSTTNDLAGVRTMDGAPLDGDAASLAAALPAGKTVGVDLLVQPAGVSDERIVTFTAARLPEPASGIITVLRDVTAERRELRRAAQVQAGLLPTDSPHVPGYDLAARFVPAGSVGGDFYDWYTIDHGVVLTLADVMGKGTGAAILAATTRSLLRAHGGGEDVVQPLVEAERGMTRDLDNAGAFVTVFRSFVHAPTGDVTYVDAGHGLSAVLTRKGAVRRLEANGFPLGVAPDEPRFAAHDRLDPGDMLLVVSDGVLDAVGGSIDELAAVWAALSRDATATEVVEAVVERAAAGDPDDDLTVLALRRSPDCDTGSSEA